MGRRGKLLVAIALLGAVLLGACGNDDGSGAASNKSAKASGANNPKVKLSLVGFAVSQAANNAAQTEFAKTPEGKNTTWTDSYGASGDQSRAVAGGLKADYVHYSLEGDVTRLVTAGLVADDWNKGTTKGIVTRSVVVIVTRKGNPKKITTWADLAKPGISIVTPNPSSSGSARWNILAAYGSVLANGGTENKAAEYLRGFFKNVASLPGSGRDATTAFLSGTGDVLISYENEAILARQEGQDLDYLVPDTTLLIENPGAVTKAADPSATKWLEFVLSKAGQTEFVKKGFRPVIELTGVKVDKANDSANPFPAPSTKLQTIATDFGGWSAVNTKFFDATNGIVTKIQKESGKS